jgi:glycosyltransferase involved in cell wall biosynthesis
VEPVTSPGAIAVLVHTFPLHSATFIANEVREMERHGLAPALVAIRAPRPAEAPAGMDDLRRRARYLLPIGPFAFVGAHAGALARQPRAYLRALRAALWRGRLPARHRLRTLIHFGEAGALRPILAEIGCRHLHVHALSGVATIAMLLREMGGPSYSLTAHGTDIFVEKVLLAEKIAGSRFTRVATRFNRDHLVRVHGADAGRIHVMPFGVDVEAFRPAAGEAAAAGAAGAAADGTIRLVSVGRLVWQKAHHLLLGACSRLRRRGLALRLTIIGEGEERPALEALRASLGLDDVVELPGAAPEAEVARALGRSDLFVLASVSEGFGVVLLEAMACGLPVVAPALNGLPEVVADGVEGRLFTPGSEEDLAAAIAALAADPDLRRRLGQAGRRRVADSCRLQDRVAGFARLLRAEAGVP